jgi:hypothetical protein
MLRAFEERRGRTLRVEVTFSAEIFERELPTPAGE